MKKKGGGGEEEEEDDDDEEEEEEKKKKKLITWKIGNLGLGNFQVSARPSGKEGGGWISKTDRQTDTQRTVRVT
jgi:hypothetical protein